MSILEREELNIRYVFDIINLLHYHCTIIFQHQQKKQQQFVKNMSIILEDNFKQEPIYDYVLPFTN